MKNKPDDTAPSNSPLPTAFERLMALETEKAEIAECFKDVFKELEQQGFPPKFARTQFARYKKFLADPEQFADAENFREMSDYALGITKGEE